MIVPGNSVQKYRLPIRRVAVAAVVTIDITVAVVAIDVTVAIVATGATVAVVGIGATVAVVGIGATVTVVTIDVTVTVSTMSFNHNTTDFAEFLSDQHFIYQSRSR